MARMINDSRKNHVLFITTMLVFLAALLTFLPWILLFVKAHFLYTFYAVILLPAPLQSESFMTQGNGFSNGVTGNLNGGIIPLLNTIIKCVNGARLFYNAIVNGVIRAMIHEVAVNFYPINRSTIFNILRNALNLIIQFATILLTFLLQLFEAIIDLFTGNGFNFTFVMVIVDLIISNLMDVIDDPPCFHPLSLEPGLFMHCLNDDLVVADVNNAGFIGFMKAVCIVICHNGTMQSDFISDILLPCTGLDAFFIFKEIYEWSLGNATAHYYDQVTRFNNRVTRFNQLSTRVANAGPAIVKFIIRKICGGIAIFCKILKGLGIPTARNFDRLLDHEQFEKYQDTYVGVCIYKGTNENGVFVGCYYVDPARGGARTANGSAVDFDALHRAILNNQIETNNTMFLFFQEAAKLRTIQDALIYNSNLPINPVLDNINNIVEIPTANITITNSYYSNSRVTPERETEPSYGYSLDSAFHAKRRKLDRNYDRAMLELELNDHLNARNESISAFKTILMTTHHLFKAAAVTLDMMRNHQTLENPYEYSRQGFRDIGFNFSEVAHHINRHSEMYYGSMEEQGFSMNLNMQGAILSFGLVGLSSLGNVFVYAAAVLYGVIGFILATMGSLGSLMNSLSGTNNNYDLGFNAILSPIVDWSGTAAHQNMNNNDTADMVLGIMNKTPIILEVGVLEIIRSTVMCNIPLPIIPLSCPPQITPTFNDDTLVFDTTLDYIINVTMCSPDPCTIGTTSEFGALCVDGHYNCWGNIPYFQIPPITTTFSPNQKQCLYNGTRFTDHLSWYNYPINWLKYGYSDGLSFVARSVVRGWHLPFTLIPAFYLFGKICFCTKKFMSFGIYIVALQYFVIPFSYATEVCPANTLFGICNAYLNYITFENGAPTADDYYCAIVGIPVFYLAYVISLLIIEFIFFFLLAGVLWAIGFDIVIIIELLQKGIKAFWKDHRNDAKYITLRKEKIE